jgi:hypothetical protein
MRRLGLMLGLLLPAVLAAADAGATLRREVARCAAAWQREDYAGILSYVPPRVVQRTGGRAATLRELKARFVQARAFGVDRLEAIPGAPARPRPIGPWLTALVPVTAILHGPHVDLTQPTVVLGISADQGKHWYFVPLHDTTPAELNAWFPELAGKIVIPVDPAPQVEIVY